MIEILRVRGTAIGKLGGGAEGVDVIERIVRKEVLSIPKWTSLNITNSLIINVCISELMLGPRKQNIWKRNLTSNFTQILQ